jgi:hypothetical protein
MDEAGVLWWTAAQQPCLVCSGQGVPVVVEVQNQDTKEALQLGLASLGGCGLGGSRFDRECLRCGARWSSSEREPR